MLSITTTELKSNFEKYLMLADKEDIFITQNSKIIGKLSNPHQDKVDMAKSLLGILSADITLEEAKAERIPNSTNCNTGTLLELNEKTGLWKFLEVLRIEQNLHDFSEIQKVLNVPEEEFVFLINTSRNLPEWWEAAIIKRYPLYTKESLHIRLCLCFDPAPSFEDLQIYTPSCDTLRKIMQASRLSLKEIAQRTAVNVPFLICFALGSIPDSTSFSSIIQRVFPDANSDGAPTMQTKPPQIVTKKVSLERRTLKQRVALWYFASSLHLCGLKEINAINDILISLPPSSRIDGSDLPSALLMRSFCADLDKQNFAVAVELGISDSTLSKVKLGEKALDSSILSALGRLCNYNYIWSFAVYAAELSLPAMEVSIHTSITPEAHAKCMSFFITRLPWLDDDSAEQILEILWDVRRAPSHRQEVKGMARAGWGTLRDHNLYQYISDLLIRHRDDLQDMYGRLANCSISTMNRILSGSIDMKYSIFRNFVSAYHLDALQTEMLRFCCDETRRMVVFDNFGYTTDQRSTISALSNSVLYLSSDDSEAIRLLCERARHRKE